MKADETQIESLRRLWERLHGSNLANLQKEARVFAQYVRGLPSFKIVDAQPYDHVGQVIVDGVLQVGNDFEKQVRKAVDAIGQFPLAGTISGFIELLNKKDLGDLINFKTGRVKYELLRAAQFFQGQGVDSFQQLYGWLQPEDHRDQLLSIKRDQRGTKFSVGQKTADYFRKLVGHCDAVAVDKKGIIPLLKMAGIGRGTYKEKRTIVQLAAISHFDCRPIDLDESIYCYYKANMKAGGTRKRRRESEKQMYRCTDDEAQRRDEGEMIGPIEGVVVTQKKGEPNSTLEIRVSRQEEYSKLPADRFPVTVTRKENSRGIGVTLSCAGNQCEASLHRYPRHDFYIGSARLRLGGNHTGLYKAFLRQSGLNIDGTEVKLRFYGHKVDIVRTEMKRIMQSP